MSELKIAGNPLPGMPWEERPEGCKNVMWRCSANPIIPVICCLHPIVYSIVR